MMGLTLLTVALQLAVIYLPFLDPFFSLAPLPPGYLAVSLSMGAITFLGVMIERFIKKRKRNRPFSVSR
jgi:Ca2+-transporting ATPase